MSEQYFSKNPSSESKPRTFDEQILGVRLSFETDAGVFSKSGMDDGTRLLLESLPELHGRVLDLGCGWGAVGTTVGAKYPNAEIVMADVNERALELAKRNLTKNRVKNARVMASDAYENVSGDFDFIILNPPIRAGKTVVYSMFDGAKSRLREGGAFYIVIRKQQGAPSAFEHLKGLFAGVKRVARDKGYWVIECRDTEYMEGTGDIS